MTASASMHADDLLQICRPLIRLVENFSVLVSMWTSHFATDCRNLMSCTLLPAGRQPASGLLGIEHSSVWRCLSFLNERMRTCALHHRLQCWAMHIGCSFNVPMFYGSPPATTMLSASICTDHASKQACLGTPGSPWAECSQQQFALRIQPLKGMRLSSGAHSPLASTTLEKCPIVDLYLARTMTSALMLVALYSLLDHMPTRTWLNFHPHAVSVVDSGCCPS